ncbi:hypothetical protein SAMN02745830_00514 [Streptomyces sp. Amel2xC10]|nr:hypothetical protein SAMN02745830_00514 [Streptomyces sp. Amel2xC10]
MARVTMLGGSGCDQARRPAEPKAARMNVSRLPGLVLPVAFLLALVAGAVWYWRHRDD